MNYLIHAKRFGAQSAQQTDGHKVQLKRSYIMKLAVFLSVVFSIQIASGAMAQKIDLQADKQSLLSVLQEIRKQSGYAILYNAKDIAAASPVTIHVKGKPISDVLPILFKNQPLLYELKGRVISIEPKPAHTKKKGQNEVRMDQEPIRGRVTDSVGTGLPDVTIQVKGTNNSTITNAAGEFFLENVDDEAVLIFSSVGFLTVENHVNGRSTINVLLKRHLLAIQEVEINAGYWKVDNKMRTGNISRVEGKIIQQQPVLDPMLALAGRVPGLAITQQSGLPGAYHAMRIRGNNSLANGNDPLFLIDGVPFNSATLSNSVIGSGATRLSPFALLSADEIESIEVLKDADATAIYGSRGANGVILITTKKGSVGKTTVGVSATTGFGKVGRTIDLLNTEQYLDMRREAFANDGVTTYPANAYDVNGTWDQDRYTDWQKILIGNTSRVSSIQGQISGGSAQTQFLVGGGYSTETTVFPGDYDTKKGTANISLNHGSKNKKFNFSISARYANNLTDQPQIDFTTNIINLAPNSPALYDANGDLNWENETWDNPMAYIKRRAKLNSKNLISNASLRYQIFDPLEVKLNIGYNQIYTVGSNITPISSYRPSDYIYPAIRSHNRAESSQDTYILEPQLNFKKRLVYGNLEATMGSTFQKSNNYTLAQTASNFSDDALIENLMAAANITVVQNRQTEYRYAALFARVNYNLMDKYILNLVARRDGSTRFAPDRKYGNFASIGAAWIFSNERIFNNSALSFGKIRASYGITGNDQLTDYQYLSTYTPYNNQYLGITGLYPTRLYTSEYGWEAVRKIEGAVDLGFLADKIKLSAVYFRNRTDNQLVGYPLPTMTGFTSIQGNLPAVLENRGWEWELNTVNISNQKFTWSTSLNISIPDSKLISYPDFVNSSYRNIYEIGKPLTISRAFHWTGVDPETGIHTYQDIDGDGNVTSPQDLQSLFNLGRRYYGGMSNTLSYRGLSLDFFLQFVKKNGRVPMTVPGSAFINQPVWLMDRWRNPGDVTEVQRFSQGGTAVSTMLTGLNNSDLVYGDASFIRLKNVSVSYQLPTDILKSYWISQCRIFAQCQNLITFTRYRGLDPETETALPVIRMITAGINLTF